MTFEPRAIWPLAAMALALAACQAEKKPATGGSAGGEVLSGSVSDAMLPIDTVRSQPPLAPKPTGSAAGADAKARGAAGKAEEEAPAEAAPEPDAPAETAEAE